MEYADLFPALAAAGVTLRLRDGRLLAGPGDRLTPELRTAIREHRERLLAARCERCGEPSAGYGYCDRCDPFAEDVDKEVRRCQGE